jgi:hypothetical protein
LISGIAFFGFEVATFLGAAGFLTTGAFLTAGAFLATGAFAAAVVVVSGSGVFLVMAVFFC